MERELCGDQTPACYLATRAKPKQPQITTSILQLPQAATWKLRLCTPGEDSEASDFI